MKLSQLAAAAGLTIALPFGASAQHDHSKGQQTPAKPTTAKAKPAPKPAEGASVKIISPTKGQVLKGDKVPIEFKLTKGKRGHHAHAYVDGELMACSRAQKARSTASNPASMSWSCASSRRTMKLSWTPATRSISPSNSRLMKSHLGVVQQRSEPVLGPA